MADRGKIMSWLEGLAQQDWRMFHSDSEVQVIAEQALALLKEQEAVEPVTEHKLFICPVCKNSLFREQKYCHECGRAVKW